MSYITRLIPELLSFCALINCLSCRDFWDRYHQPIRPSACELNTPRVAEMKRFKQMNICFEPYTLVYYNHPCRSKSNLLSATGRAG